jgi:hexosaminidase
VPVVTIQDRPRFPWRGLMIDVARHFMPVEVIKRNLDGMAAVKLNVFHWHLSDNQGFRVESKEFPKLQEMGSDGLFYTQDQVRDVIAYAQERGIRVVPEFDVPGHSTAWFVGYPQLASGPGPYQIERRWGVFDPAMDPTNEDVYKFLDKFIGEMAKLFPDQYFHIGGDEVNGKQWDANPKIQEWMRAHGIKNNEQLQTYFTNRVQKIVEKHGKTMIGWDEILNADSPKSVVIQSWRGQKSLADASRQGYRGLLSTGYYVDLNWPAARHYAVDPLGNGAASLTPEQKARILGGEACMWSEYVSPENIDSRIWPRTAAIAERLWSPQEVTDVHSMYQRMAEESDRLTFLGLTQQTNYQPMLRRIAGRDDILHVKLLADVVEPVKDYEREKLAKTPALQSTPLNRLIDAARPESATARRFGNMVDAFLAGTASDQDKAEMRRLLTAWQENNAALQPVIAESFLLSENALLSQNLSALGAAGLAAMDYLAKRQPSPEAWRDQQIAIIETAKQPIAQLLLAAAGPVEKLVRASGQGSGKASGR